MYSLGMPVSAIRTKMRQEFERHRFVNQLNVVDVLLFQSHAEYQVCGTFRFELGTWNRMMTKMLSLQWGRDFINHGRELLRRTGMVREIETFADIWDFFRRH